MKSLTKFFSKVNTDTLNSGEETSRQFQPPNEELVDLKPSDSGKDKTIIQACSLNSGQVGNTVISEETEVNGSLTSRGNISVCGRIKGNITSEAHVKVTGSVEGDIVGKSVEILNGSVYGNIISKLSVSISEKSIVEGDIKCDKLELNGKVHGNLQAKTSASLGKEAVIIGNLTSLNLSIQEGATINGEVKVIREKSYLAETAADAVNGQAEGTENKNTHAAPMVAPVDSYVTPLHVNAAN